ncbi:potassium channel family protein [Acidaminobacter hydrogenoformans]|uniref:Voltage-gated potassium channel n=1 Tax=Acidaminobacter hydrogenoformans DSM 2784 TaxID=1120920 RepID=A0A1G5RQE5_9FIRM|nr:potassium channel protein [Acidaminobacter hydrogenoformans]SCZ76333.1 voltage-gated potassium channel [Acidaminobacter hydrogenoformans DSM 2784]
MHWQFKRIFILISSLLFLLVVGTIGYMTLAEVEAIDALYMTVITLSTVGFKEVVELSHGGKIFTIFLIFGGISFVAYSLTYVAAFVFGGEFTEIMRRRAMEHDIDNLKDHYILCGAGSTGMSVINRFQKSDAKYIAIEINEDRVNTLLEEGVMALLGDATQEDVLEKAGIHRCRGLVTCLANDADNVFTVLTARGMKSDLHIVSRAIDTSSHKKLKRAGANNTLSPNELGGDRMAVMLLRPTVMSFLEITTHMGDIVFDIEEILITENCEFAGKSLRDSGFRSKTGLNVLAVKKAGETTLKPNPDASFVVESDDKLLVLGQLDQIDRLKRMIAIQTKGV